MRVVELEDWKITRIIQRDLYYEGSSKRIRTRYEERLFEKEDELGWFTKTNNQTISKLWDQSGKALRNLLAELSDESQQEKTVVAIAPPLAHIALLGHCLNLTKEQLGLFHLDSGSITVIDFPDGPAKQGVIKCTNYTAHLGKWSAPITKSALNNVKA